jgi:hypothetical protein
MYCPNCAAEKSLEHARYCSNCGLDLVGDRKAYTELKGLRHGIILLVIGLLLIPVWMFVGAAFPADDKLVESAPSTTPVEAIAWIAMWVMFLAGAARIAYSLIFERDPQPQSMIRSYAERSPGQTIRLEHSHRARNSNRPAEVIGEQHPS